MPVLLGRQSQEDYLQQEIGWYAEAIQAVNKLPAGSKTLFFWEPRTYYCEGICLADGILDNWWYFRNTADEPDTIAGMLNQYGVTHVLIYNQGARMIQESQSVYHEEDWIEFEKFIDTQLESLEEMGEIYSLYKLKDHKE